MTLKEFYDLLFGSYNPVQKGLVLLALIAFIVLYLKDPLKGREATQRSFETFLNILILILAGIALGAVIQAVVPKEIIAKTLGGESGFLGILLATILGAIIPGGPYVLLPILASLLTAGADISPIITFLVAWSTIAFGRIPLELAFLEPKTVALRVVVGVPLPIIAGYLAKVISSIVS